MAVEQTWKYVLSGASAPADSSAVVVSADTIVSSSFTLAGSTTDQEQTIAFKVGSALKGVWIVVESNNGTVTMETNSSSSPVHTKTFASGGGNLVYDSTSAHTVPFASTDVTTTYWTNAGSATATITYTLLYNA